LCPAFPGEWATWYFSGAIATHAAAVASVFAEDLSYHNLAMRGLFGVLLFISLRQLVYVPINMLVEQCFVPFVIPERFMPGPVLMAGDGVLFEGPWLRPEQYHRGDVVLYDIPSVSGRQFYSNEGYGIDRIVGIPGDSIVVRKGRLLVNGETPPDGQGPLGSAESLPDIVLMLGDGQYAVFPTRIPLTGANADIRQQLIQIVSTTNLTSIHGRIRWRLKPWSRFGKVL
jgi:signal peptidase I